MRIIDEIMNYSGAVENLEELHEKMALITNEANSRICQATGLPPILVFKKEKEHLLPPPNDKILSFYKIITIQAKVNTNGLFSYKQHMYSAPPELIGKSLTVQVADNNLYVYYNGKLITVHNISDKKVNYHGNHHFKMIEATFPKKKDDDVKEFAAKHLKELEKFHEQLSRTLQ